MFKMLESLTKAAVAVITVPVAIVADIVTLGGLFAGKNETYTGEVVSDFVKNLKNATKPN